MTLVKKKWERKKQILITNNNIIDKIVIYKKKEKSNLREIKTTVKSTNSAIREILDTNYKDLYSI